MSSRGLFEFPRGMAQLLVGINVVVFAICLSQSSTANIATDILLRYGAMYSQALERHEYWRLVAYGFLHANPVHLFANMLCLVLWGGPLERRVETLYFTLIYLCGLVLGGIVSYMTHPGPYIAVGASGAISAVLGALLCLRVLGKIGLPWSFFLVNIGLNVMIAASASRVDWQAHFGGFIGGIISCACLDVAEKTIVRLLRCKFPEFVKMNIFVALAIVFAWGSSRIDLQNTWVVVIASVTVGVATIKGLDLILSMKKGLAAVVIILALANAALIFPLADLLSAAATSFCMAGARNSATAIVATACTNASVVIGLASMGAFALTFLFYWPQFARGMADVGFVGAALRGERERRWGV